MSYKKIIKSGNNIEIYEYEREPDLLGRRRGRRANNDDNKSLGNDRENSFSEEQLGKRQDNARHASVVFRRIVMANLSGAELPLLITITYKENETDITKGYEDFRSFIQTLRYKYGKTFKYICVPEFQERGAVHFHALFWGLPSEVFLQERKNRTIARIWKKGFVFIKQTDGHNKLSSYLAKYMSKAFTDSRLKNQKAYTASRNISRPEIYSGSFSFWPLIEECEEGGELLKDTEYSTKWLGKCRYRNFKLI